MKEKRKTPEGVTKEEFEKQLLELSDVLDTLPFSTLVRIGCAMNEYEWSEEFPGKPKGWDEMSIDERTAWSMPLYGYIRAKVGDKAMLRYSHKTEFGKTDQEFEDWWDASAQRSLKEEQKDYNRYCGSQHSDNKGYYSCLLIEAVLFFTLGLLIAFFLR